MAKAVMPKKAKTIRIWLWIITLSFVALFFTMKYTVLGKNNIINGFVANCAQSTPLAPNWPNELTKFGYVGNTEWLPNAYCECVLVPVFTPMTETQIRQFPNLEKDERLKQMGGNDGIQKRHEQCLIDLRPPISS